MSTRRRRLLAAAPLLAAAVLAWPLAGPSAAEEDDPAAERWGGVVEEAEAALELIRRDAEQGTAARGDAQEWSARLMDAKIAAGHDEVSSRRAHLELLEQVLADQRRRQQVGAAAEIDVVTARYHVARARAELAEAEGR